MIVLAYFSSAATPLSDPDLDALLAQARRNNSAADITGLLCHLDGSFLQFLEGDADTVDALYARISQDPRHHAVLLVHRAEIQTRAFPDWSMALVQPSSLPAERQAFLHGLRDIEIDPAAEQGPLLDGLLRTFRAWLR